jgi:hypothetical protein
MLQPVGPTSWGRLPSLSVAPESAPLSISATHTCGPSESTKGEGAGSG